MKLLKSLFIFSLLSTSFHYSLTMQDDDNPALEATEFGGRAVTYSIGGGPQHVMVTSSTPQAQSSTQGFYQFWYDSPNLDEIRQVLESGTVNVNESWPRPPLVAAIQSGNVPLAKLLIEHGANPRLSGMSGFSALDLIGAGSHTLGLDKALEALPRMRRLFVDYYLAHPDTNEQIRTQLNRIIQHWPIAEQFEVTAQTTSTPSTSSSSSSSLPPALVSDSDSEEEEMTEEYSSDEELED